MLNSIKAVGQGDVPIAPSAADLLAEAKAARVTVEIRGDHLKIRGPRLHQELGARLMARKSEVLEAIRESRRVPSSAWDAARADAVCAECARVILSARRLLTRPQRNVLKVFIGLCRRYRDKRDPELWAMPETLRRQLARWKHAPYPLEVEQDD